MFGRKVELPPPPPPTLVESLKEVLKKVDVVTHLQWAAVAGLTKVDEAAAAAKVEAAEKVDEAAGKLGVEAPPVSMEVIDQAAELTKGKVAEGGAAVDTKVKAAVGPAQ